MKLYNIAPHLKRHEKNIIKFNINLDFSTDMYFFAGLTLWLSDTSWVEADKDHSTPLLYHRGSPT